VKKCPGPLIRDRVETTDSTYIALRDRPELGERRELVERMWSSYWAYADEAFCTDLPRDCFSRFWEMDLSCALLDLGHSLCERSGTGPDVCIEEGASRIWLEAVAPRAGSGPNGAPDLVADLIAREFTDDAYGGVPGFGSQILRYRGAIKEKLAKYEQYLRSELIQPSEPYVIALNGFQVPGSIIDDDDVPTILKAVYPLGPPKWRFDFAKGEVTDLGPSYRGAVKTAAGSDVPTTIFLDQHYAGVSAVLYARCDVYNRPARPGGEFIVVHNREASNQLDRGWIRAGVEFWADHDGIERHDWEDEPASDR